MHMLIIVIAAVIVVFIVADAIYEYSTTPGTELLTAFRNSATIAWSRTLAASSALVALSAGFAEYLGQPAISDAIKQMIKPEYVPVFGFAVAVITEWARRRTLPKE